MAVLLVLFWWEIFTNVSVQWNKIGLYLFNQSSDDLEVLRRIKKYIYCFNLVKIIQAEVYPSFSDVSQCVVIMREYFVFIVLGLNAKLDRVKVHGVKIFYNNFFEKNIETVYYIKLKYLSW